MNGCRCFRRTLILVLAGSAAACAGRSAVPRPFPAPDPVAAPADALPSGTATAVTALLATAAALTGAPYRNGGADPGGFDCSGFVQYVFGQHGVLLPRTVERQAGVGTRVGAPEPGDLVFFATLGDGPTHVGIAMGSDRFIHAPSSRGVVRIERLTSTYWGERFLEARRVP
jgi:cell wall-associated NlpC family hydrolase